MCVLHHGGSGDGCDGCRSYKSSRGFLWEMVSKGSGLGVGDC